jgi:hypothetical protein
MNCRPPRQTVDWPARRELVERLQEQLRRILRLLDSATDEQLATVSGHIIHGLHDEAKHSGEMYLLLKLFRVEGDK